MSMVINTNQSALSALNSLEKTKFKLDSSMEKLSSGLKINRGADDAAGLAIATRMAAQIGSLMQAAANAQAGVSLINIADSSLGTITDSLIELRALAVQAANGTLTSSDRASINAKAESLLNQINSIASQANFNELDLLDGSFDTILQVGTEAGDSIQIKIESANTADVGAIFYTGNAVAAALEKGDLILDGAAIPATENDGLSYDMPEASAIAVAAAINTSGTDANTRAVVNPTVTETTTFAASGNPSGIMTINGIETKLISLPGTLDGNVQNAMVAINAISTETGVEASTDEIGNLVLTAADGRNITVEYSDSMANTDLGAVAAGTITGTVKLTSSNPITVSGSNPDRAGFVAGTYSDLTALSTAKLDTQANAIQSLAVIDGAIDTISGIRSDIGAIENRLYVAIDNLSATSVNLQDAKSQIMDTDFAVEMTNFAKQQILQQAGVAMLAQANANPQSVLKLLQ